MDAGMELNARTLLCTIALTWMTQVLAQESGLPTAESLAKQLIGGEYVDLVTLQPSCSVEGGSVLGASAKTSEWSYSNLWCIGKPVLTLERFLGYEGHRAKVRVVDAIVIPTYAGEYSSPREPNTLYKVDSTQCTLDGKSDEYVVALVREPRPLQNGQRQKVVYAWGFDFKQEKITPLSVKRVRCMHDGP